MTRRKICLTAATAVAALALTACGSSSSSTSSSPSSSSSGSTAAAGGGGVLTNMVNIATEQPIATLDPTNSTAYELNAEVFDFLTQLSSDGKVVAGAATSWSGNADDSVWTYKLRSGMTFSDGTPVTAADVAFSYQTVINNPKSLIHSYVTDIKTVTAPDASTVVFTMLKPYVAWPAQTATIGIVSKAAYTSEGAAKFATDPVGSGPYTVVSFDAASAKIVLKANPKYWAGEPKAQNATIQQVTDATTRLNGLQSGQFDLALVGGGQVATAKSAGLHTQSEISTKNIYIGFNTDAAGVSSPMLRQAISLAIDRQAIVKTLLSGLATPTGQMPTPSLNAYDPSIQAPTLDVAKAKSLVASSGYSGQTIELEYSTGYVKQRQPGGPGHRQLPERGRHQGEIGQRRRQRLPGQLVLQEDRRRLPVLDPERVARRRLGRHPSRQHGGHLQRPDNQLAAGPNRRSPSTQRPGSSSCSS